MAATMACNMVCSKAVAMQPALALPESRVTSVSKLKAGFPHSLFGPYSNLVVLATICIFLMFGT